MEANGGALDLHQGAKCKGLAVIFVAKEILTLFTEKECECYRVLANSLSFESYIFPP